MGRVSACLATVAVVALAANPVALGDSPVAPNDNTGGVCGEQAKCLAFVARECEDDQRKVCVRWRPLPGCERDSTMGFPDVCTVTDEATQTGTGLFTWHAGWFRRVCQMVDPTKPTVYSIRDSSACTGEATSTLKYTGGRLSTVARCSPATTEMCDMIPYEHWWFEAYADVWAEQMSWTETSTPQVARYFFDVNDPDFRPAVPNACRWEVAAVPCPAQLGGRLCCESEEASCKACKTGWSLTDYCAGYPDALGCPQAGKLCCEGVEATCEACKAEMSVEDYCILNPDMDGCCDLFSDLPGCDTPDQPVEF